MSETTGEFQSLHKNTTGLNNKNPTKVQFAVALIIVLSAAIYRLNSRSEIQRATKTTILMDTLVTVTAYGTPDICEKVFEITFGILDAIERLSSFHVPDSLLSRLNANGKPGERNATFTALIEVAERAYNETDGYFDPTFSILHEAYGFYDQKGRLPDDEEIMRKLKLVGWSDHIKFNNGEPCLSSGAKIDLGGIAGGFGLDLVIRTIRESGCQAFFIDKGGDLWMEGVKPSGLPWKVAVKNPNGTEYLAEIETEGPVAISTSGDYERFVEVDGVRYGHIMDPKSGKPVKYYRSVTVIASSPIDADIYSTALFAMPPTTASAWAARNNVPALFLPASGPIWLSDAGKDWFRNITDDIR